MLRRGANGGVGRKSWPDDHARTGIEHDLGPFPVHLEFEHRSLTRDRIAGANENRVERDCKGTKAPLVYRLAESIHPGTPDCQLLECRPDAFTGRRQRIHRSARRLDTTHDAVGLHPSQPLAEKVRGDSWEPIAQFLEPGRATEKPFRPRSIG